VTEVPGTQGYAAQAESLVARYEAIPLDQKYRAAIRFLAPPPALALDVGAATGADAAWLASRGYRVVAVEPTAEFRAAGAALHPSPGIQWVDDGLPELNRIVASGSKFDAILLTAVWMHLDESQRTQAMPVIATLLAPDGLILMMLRHGPVPAGRRMFEVTADETVTLAARCGLRVLLNERAQSVQVQNRAAGVEWTRLAFRPG
jgi:SAM-dependent methyltransferase